MAVTNKGGTPVLGLDIGAAFIKAVELRPSRGALVVTGVGILPTPPGCIVNDEITDPVTLAAAVKQCLAENGIKTKKVVVSVAGQAAVVVRVIEVPRMNEKELEETMRWEIDRHIPFAPEEVVKDFWAMGNNDPNSANMNVLLAVAQKTVVNGLMNTILAAGLQPVAIDPESLAGARALLDVDDAFAQQTVALVNIGSTKTDVAIFERGLLSFPRTIPVAGNAMTEAVATRLSLDVAAAEQLKKQHGFVPVDAAARFGSNAAPAAEEDQFSFSEFSGGIDFAAPLSASAAQAPPTETTEGPVFGSFGSTPDGPVFESGGIGAPTLGGPAEATPFGTAPSFGAPEAPTFDLPDVGPANLGPAGHVPQEFADTIPVQEVTPPAAEPEPSVPEVLSEAEKHRREISDAFMPVVAELVTEVKRSVEYYTTRQNNARVDRVVLYGGVSNLPGLQGFMEAELGLPVQSAALPHAVSVSGKVVSPEYLSQVANMLPVAIGLASREAIAGPPAPPKNGKAKKG